MRTQQYFKFIASVLLAGFLVPMMAQASTAIEISGWIPYWRAEKGTASAIPHINDFTEINPFLYTVKKDGTLYQADKISDPEWVALQEAAKEAGVRFIPTIMWSDGDTIDAILRDPVSRKKHVASIITQIYRYGYDGIDIDYEAKLAETAPYYSLFLKELYEAIGYDKWIMCTVEPRMPLEARYLNPDEKLELLAYANDFDAINTYCDRVRVMAYDQGRADIQMNMANEHPYIPVADVDWVEKTIEFMAQDIDREKMMIGVPTYGYEYDMYPSEASTTKMNYSRLWSFSQNYSVDIAQKLGLNITRHQGGEAELIFPAASSTEPELPRPDATRVLVWSDAQAIGDKIALAQRLGVKGVSIFKIDGGEDPGLWDVLANYQTANVAGQKAADVALSRDGIASRASSVTSSVSLNMPQYDLEYGDRNEDVRTLQKFLNNNGLLIASSGPGSKGNETTFFGPATKAALSRYQELHGITPAVGYYGPKTRAMIAGTQE